jgi:hypothetical protein
MDGFDGCFDVMLSLEFTDEAHCIVVMYGYF